MYPYFLEGGSVCLPWKVLLPEGRWCIALIINPEHKCKSLFQNLQLHFAVKYKQFIYNDLWYSLSISPFLDSSSIHVSENVFTFIKDWLDLNLLRLSVQVVYRCTHGMWSVLFVYTLWLCMYTVCTAVHTKPVMAAVWSLAPPPARTWQVEHSKWATWVKKLPDFSLRGFGLGFCGPKLNTRNKTKPNLRQVVLKWGEAWKTIWDPTQGRN